MILFSFLALFANRLGLIDKPRIPKPGWQELAVFFCF